MNRNLLKLICTGFLVALGVSAWSQPLYTIVSNTNYDNQTFGLINGEQFGNNVYLNNVGYNIDNNGGFVFEYYVPGQTLSASVGVNITFYNVNSVGAPTTPFYESGWFYNNPSGSIPASATGDTLGYGPYYDGGYNDFTLGDGTGQILMPANFVMPTQFLFSVEFTNISANQITLPLASNVTTPSNNVAGDYWVNNNGVWSEYTNAVGNNMLFAFTGVPEPSVVGFGGIGGLLLLGAMKLKQFKRKA